MPIDQKFKKLNSLLSPTEITNIVANLKTFGIEEVRLTGGEPLLHPKFKAIVKELSALNLKKLGLTTNAILLDENLDFLKEHGISSINISFDSLDPKSFEFITKTNKYEEVKAAILKARAMGFTIKLNTVMLKNINFEEVDQFLEFAAEHDIEVRFLELMKIGEALQYFNRHFVSAEEILSRISKNWKLEKIEMPKDSTSFNYLATKDGKSLAKVGFIASESKPFCNGCSRLRLSNQGTLRPCIMINEGPNLSDLPLVDYEMTLKELIEKKPNTRLHSNNLKMNEIGG
ncbi:MAG: cyclic pyranopterin phosphate synthase [Bacteriovoracaceae bacterium]|jgi:cyclic pyranopterin phosphate synthase